MYADRINKIAALVRAKRYLEIGVSEGETFFNVVIGQKVGVDPAFRFDFAAKANKSSRFFPIPSDEFFRTERSEPFDVIFIDGLHTFEQTLRDFLNSLAVAHAKTIWIIDDTVPRDNFGALPDQARCYRLRHQSGRIDWDWMGDVFKVVFFIRNAMPHYNLRTFTGHGQTVVWRDYSRLIAEPSLSLAAVASMTYEDFLDHYSTIMHPAQDEEIYAEVEHFMRRS